jgi:nicotinamidase-related amidase
MQHDYCKPGFYIDRAGYDTARLRKPIPRIQDVLSAARHSGAHVIYTQHGRRRTYPETPSGARPGETSFPLTACRGEPGWEIVPELEPRATDTVLQKSTINAFFSGELRTLLTKASVQHLAFCGNTIDVCVHSTLRAAVDLGYDCLLLADCCGAVNDDLHRWAIESVKVEDGVFGTVATASAFVRALRST